MGKKRQPAAVTAPASLLLKGKALLGRPQHEHKEGAEAGSTSSSSSSSSSSRNGTAATGSSSPITNGNGGGPQRRPGHGGLAGASWVRGKDDQEQEQQEGEGDAAITPESSPGSSNGDVEAYLSSSSSPLAPAPVPGPTTAEGGASPPAPAPPSSPTPPLSLSEVGGSSLNSSRSLRSRSSRRAAHEAALWALLGAVRRGDGDGAIVDAPLLDRLLALGRLAFDPNAERSGGASPPWAGAAGVSLGWYARLLEAVAESELGARPCALHRARIGAVFQCAAFFCRLKASSGAGLGGRHSPVPVKQRGQQQRRPSGSPRAAAAAGGGGGGGEWTNGDLSSALADMPPVCRGELRRRLATLLASLQCPRALAREEVDAMRRDDLLVALRWLESPLAPLDITLRSVLLPLLEGACKDVLMAGALGEEVTTRLELELSALDEEQQQHATPTLWRAADSVWRLAAGGLRGRLLQAAAAAAEGAGGKKSRAQGGADDAADANAEEQKQEGEGQGPEQPQPQSPSPQPEEGAHHEPPPPPPPSQLTAALAPRVADLLAWLRTDAAALACRHSSGLAELLSSLPPTLRASLRAQVYEGPGDFVRVFARHEASLQALPLPPSTTPCLPMPPSSPPRAGRRAGGLGFGECHRLAPGVAQALKDIGRERFVLEGEVVGTPGEVQARLAGLLVRRCGVGGGGGEKGAPMLPLPKGLEAAVQQCLCAASRTTFGGDVFFIVRDLFGGDGVVVAPLSVKRARGPVLSALDQHEDKGGRESGGESPVEIEVRGGAGTGSNGGGGGGVGGVVSIVVTSRTAYGLYADEMVSGGSGSGGRNASSSFSSPSVVQQQGQQRRPRRRSLTHPMITLHATLVETIPVLITTPNNANASDDEPSRPPPQPELRVLARGLGAGRVLKLRAERPPSPCPSPPPIFAVYPEDAAAAGGGGPMRPPLSSPPRSLSPSPPPARENDEISV